MNYLILDTEQTYNYGYIVINEIGEQLVKKNLVVKNNFENRKLIGENTYKRKLPIYEKDNDAIFISSAEAASHLSQMIQNYNIDTIIAHNASEDKRQVELLAQQTGIEINTPEFYDSISLVKILFPNNSQTSLEAVVEDITGINIKQTHTALQDCQLLYMLINPVIKYLPQIIKYQEIFAHDSNYEITATFFENLDHIYPFPKDREEIAAILNMEDHKKMVNNFIDEIASCFHLWEVKEYVKMGKTGKPLKTPGKAVHLIDKNEVNAIADIFVNIDSIADMVVSSCVKYQAEQESNEDVAEKIKLYKAELEKEYAKQKASLEKNYKYKLDTLNKKAEAFNKEMEQKQAEYKNMVANHLMTKLQPLFNGGLFNSEAKMVKNLVKTNNKKALLDWLTK